MPVHIVATGGRTSWAADGLRRGGRSQCRGLRRPRRSQKQGARPQALGQLQEEARLANLPGTGEELDAAGRGLGEPPGEHLAALAVAEPELCIDHTRIIIRLCL